MNVSNGGNSSPLGQTKLLQHIQKPLKKLSMSAGSPTTPRKGQQQQQLEKGKLIGCPFPMRVSGDNRVISANGHSKQSNQDQCNTRKLSSPLDYRDSGVYLGERRRDPVLEMLNLRKVQRSKSPNLMVKIKSESGEDRLGPISPLSCSSAPPLGIVASPLSIGSPPPGGPSSVGNRRQYSKSAGESTLPSLSDLEYSLDEESQEEIQDEEGGEENPPRPVSSMACVGGRGQTENEFLLELDNSLSRVGNKETVSVGANVDTDGLALGLTAKAASLFISAPSPFLFRKQRMFSNNETKKEEKSNQRKVAKADLMGDSGVEGEQRLFRSARQASLFFRRSRSLTGRDRSRNRLTKEQLQQQRQQEWQSCLRGYYGTKHRVASAGDELHSGAQDTAPRKISQPAMVRFHIVNESTSYDDKKESTVKKKRSFADPIAKKLSFLRRRPTDSSLVSPSSSNDGCTSPTPIKSTITSPGSPNPQPLKLPCRDDVRKWASSFEDLLSHQYGVMLFRLFLQREFSEENIDFWMACEEYKRMRDHTKLPNTAKQIYSDYVAVQAPKEVNLDSVTRSITAAGCNSPTRNTFEQAQHRIQSLMEKDSYPRFLRSDLYLDLVKKC